MKKQKNIKLRQMGGRPIVTISVCTKRKCYDCGQTAKVIVYEMTEPLEYGDASCPPRWYWCDKCKISG